MLKRVQFPHKPISCPSSDQTKPIEVIVFLRSFIIQSDLGGGLTEGCMSALPIHPLGWDMRLSSILDGDFNYFCGRKMLAHGWINWSSSGRCKGWDGLSWISLLLAGFLLFLLAGLFFLYLDTVWLHLKVSHAMGHHFISKETGLQLCWQHGQTSTWW